MDNGSTQARLEVVPSNTQGAPAREDVHPQLRFPAEDGGKSLTEMAQRDLDATLQLLAERGQYITGAAGAAIALRDKQAMVCRAGAGAGAPRVGSHLQLQSGLSAESMRRQQILRCDDTETDPRVNRESCRSLGIASVLVMPLVDESDVVGVFELFSDKTQAFAERDIAALERLGEMVHTALAHAQAARQVEEAQGKQFPMAGPVEVESAHVSSGTEEPDSILAVEDAQAPIRPKRVVIPMPPATAAESRAQTGPTSDPGKSEAPKVDLARIGKCEACGFPVSPGRSLCLDCESAQARGEPRGANPVAAQAEAAIPRPVPEQRQNSIASPEPPAFLSRFVESDRMPEKPGFIAAHKYLLALLLVAAILALAWLGWRP